MEAIGASVLSGIGALIVQKLDAFLSQEAKLFFGIRDDLQFIKDEVQWATAFLQDMSSHSITEDGSSKQLKEWLKKVKDLIYEAEDVFDEYKYYTAQRGIILGNKCVLLRRLKARRHIASHLNKLKLKAKDVKERRERYDLPAGLAAHIPGSNATYGTSLKPTNMPDPRLRAHYVQEDQLVGMASQRDAIINWLVEDGMPQLRVISVVGPGGMGKTTIAIKSYESPKVANGQFSCRAHITVSQAFDFNNLMKSLIKQFFNVDFEAMTANEYVKEIIERLRDERYLVLLDDVWSVEAWRSFSCAFPDNGKGSRIIVTTRNDAVAYTCSSGEHVYEIQPLPHEQSKELFCKRVFLVPPFSCPPHLEELMEGILKQCGGMPLAIVTIAGILVSNKEHSKEHWQRVHDHIGHQWEDGAENMRRILMLSYNDLPYDIKPCFLYLSMFPEDAKLKRSEVARRWIAEGLVSGSDVEQCARSYFDELANRNLIDPAIIQFENVKRWKIHDLILDLIVEKAVDENFVYIKKKTPRDPKIRRIVVHEEVNTLDDLDLSLARSLSLSFTSNRKSESEMLNLKKMRLLRMLDLNGCKFIKNRHIEQICEMLLLLKHLDLRDTKIITKLPESIEMLQDLEVLDIRATNVKTLPRTFIKLKQLSHFYAGGSIKMHAEEIMKLRNMGSSLRVLNLTVDKLEIEVLQALGQLVHLEKLNIRCYNSRNTDSAGIWKRTFLQALKDLSNSSLRSLSIIQLVRSAIDFTDDDLLPPLKKLETLNSSLHSLTILLEHSNEHLTDDDLLTSLKKLETFKFHGPFLWKGVPRWFESLHGVTKMSLRLLASTVESQQNDIRLLGSLPRLVILRLHVYGKNDMVFCTEGFINLKNLLILFSNGYNNEIRFEKDALSNLEYLHLFPNFGVNVFCIENLIKLKEVTYISRLHFLEYFEIFLY